MDARDYQNALYEFVRNSFRVFVERAFLELNPRTEFLPNWHLDVMCDELDKVRSGTSKPITVICVPPRSLKSHCSSVCLPAYLLGHNPSAQIICVSYAQDLADKFATECRALMQSPLYRALFPATHLSSKRPPLDELLTTRHGVRLATSVGGVVTGYGGDIVIVDDPLKPEDAFSQVARKKVNEWFSRTLRTRLNNQRTGRFVIVMQRLHEDDLVQHILDTNNAEDVRLLEFPAIADKDETYEITTPFGNSITYTRRLGDLLHPEREDRATLDRLRESMGTYNFSAPFLQSPVPSDGGIVKPNWFRRYTPEQLPFCAARLQSWDTAVTPGEFSDWSVCTTWLVVYLYMKHYDYNQHPELDAGKFPDMYLVDVYRAKLDFPGLKKAVIEQKLKFNPGTVLIEDKSSGTPLIQELHSLGHAGIQPYVPPPNCDKKMRMYACCSPIEGGYVYLPENAEWLSTYLSELRAFPYGRHDDLVDSTSQAIHWVNRSKFTAPHSVSLSKVLL
jgi:predicted phage terminase large subunit-like protein